MALSHNKSDHDTDAQSWRPRVNIPPPRRVTPEEIARRRALYEETIAARDAIGLIGISTDELIRDARGLAWSEEEEHHGPS